MAHGGVLFLDEVGDIEPALQTKLLRFLDSGELFRVGDNEARRVDALVVSATNRPLEKDVEDGRFRADLLARLGHVIAIPPLRERPRTSRCWSSTSWAGTAAAAQDVRARDARRCCARTTGRSTCASCSRWSSARSAWWTATSSCPRTCPTTCAPARPRRDRRRRSAEAPRPAARGGRGRGEASTSCARSSHAQGNRRKAIELLQISPETFYRRLEEYGLHKKG